MFPPRPLHNSGRCVLGSFPWPGSVCFAATDALVHGFRFLARRHAPLVLCATRELPSAQNRRRETPINPHTQSATSGAGLCTSHPFHQTLMSAKNRNTVNHPLAEYLGLLRNGRSLGELCRDRRPSRLTQLRLRLFYCLSAHQDAQGLDENDLHHASSLIGAPPDTTPKKSPG